MLEDSSHRLNRNSRRRTSNWKTLSAIVKPWALAFSLWHPAVDMCEIWINLDWSFGGLNMRQGKVLLIRIKGSVLDSPKMPQEFGQLFLRHWFLPRMVVVVLQLSSMSERSLATSKVCSEMQKRMETRLRDSMRFYEILWDSMGFYEILWDSMRFYEILWDSMRFYEILWDSMRFYEILWDSMYVCIYIYIIYIYR